MRSPSVSRSLVLMFLLVRVSATLLGCDSPGDMPDTGNAHTPNATFQALAPLTVDDVRTIIAQAVTQAVESNVRATIAVLDRGGNVLGVFQMTNARTDTVIGSSVSPHKAGLEGVAVPATFAAISKGGTAAFFSTSGNAFTTRTAGDIIQEHRPVAIMFTPGGPLFGVQFSNLPCTDIKTPPLPLGLSSDPGGLPLYKNGSLVGGIGVEVDGVYSVDRHPFDTAGAVEELLALAGARGFEAPSGVQGDTLLLDGVRLPYLNVAQPPAPPTRAFNALPGTVVPVILRALTFFDGTLRGTPDPAFGFAPATAAGLAARIAVDSQGRNRFPFRESSTPGGLTARDVEAILTQGIQQAYRTRAAIRQPRDSFAQVNVAVVDLDGTVLGYLGTPDAPFFGFDVSVQKARTAEFFSSSRAGRDLSAAGLGNFVQAAQRDGVAFDGSIAMSNRAIGFLHRPFYPDGIDGTPAGPLSTSLPEWSPFNVGLQLAIVQEALFSLFTGGPAQLCSPITGVQNGVQIFAGSVPLYKNGQLVGAVGVSGDGIDQDDLVASASSTGFEAPPARRSDQVVVRGARLPFVKFPRNPENF